MLLTESALIVADGWRARLLNGWTVLTRGHSAPRRQPYQFSIPERSDEAQVRLHDGSDDTEYQASLLRYRSVFLRHESADQLSTLQQRARVAALRGLSDASEGSFANARSAFADAARLDPDLDLGRLPRFWLLPKQGHEAAIGALRDAGRDRDAIILLASVRARFRPRLVRAPNRVAPQSNGTVDFERS